MKVLTNVIVSGSMMRAAVALKRMVRSHEGAGIANVDPEPLSQVAGEGIDLDRDIAAHETFADQCERLPPDPND